jgi:hypothetical protein
VSATASGVVRQAPLREGDQGHEIQLSPLYLLSLSRRYTVCVRAAPGTIAGMGARTPLTQIRRCRVETSRGFSNRQARRERADECGGGPAGSGASATLPGMASPGLALAALLYFSQMLVPFCCWATRNWWGSNSR